MDPGAAAPGTPRADPLTLGVAPSGAPKQRQPLCHGGDILDAGRAGADTIRNACAYLAGMFLLL